MPDYNFSNALLDEKFSVTNVKIAKRHRNGRHDKTAMHSVGASTVLRCVTGCDILRVDKDGRDYG